ncbi:MAG: alpha/beta hydrolase [Cyanobacteria bacterium P01_G01_bin.38]
MKDLPLYVEISGNLSGPTIVFLHAMGTSGWMWQEQVKLLSDFNCIVPDLPGHGQSNLVPWMSFSETAQLVSDLIQAHDSSGKAHIVGLSLGAYVGLQLLSETPSVAEHVILSGLHVLPMPNKKMMSLMNYLIAPLVKSDLLARLNANALKISEAQFEGYHHSFKQMSPRAFFKVSRDAANFEMPDNIDAVATPTLIVAGEREHALIHQSQKALVRTMPNAKSYVAPNVGHGWSLEAPELFSKTVRAWIQNQPLPNQLQSVV